MTSSVGKSDIVSHAKYNVQYKSKFDKCEDRTLILTSHCFHVQFVQGTPPKTIIKTECTVPFIDIAALETDRADEIAFLLHDQSRLVYSTTANNVLSIIVHIMSSLMLHFPEIKIEERMIQIKAPDPDRLKSITESLEQRRQRIDVSPCGSFRGTYEYFCKYFNTPRRDEVVWDVETVYHTQNKKTLILKDFDHIDGKDLLPIIGAVAFSNWFTGLDASGVRLNVDAQTQVLQVLKKNRQLESLNLENSSLKSEFCSKMPGCIESTGGTISEICLSNNPIGDAGVVALSGFFMKLRINLHRVMLSSCGITARGANRLAESFAGSIHSLQATLTHLDLSSNSLKGEELSQFYNFLANQNSLQFMDLTKSDCPIDTLSASLSRGCTQHLRVLRLSSNPFFPTKKATTVSDTWRQFFTSTIALEEVHLSGCRLPLEAIKLLFVGLSSNHSISNFFLNLSSNDLRAIGASDLLSKYLSELTMISTLDISDNDFNHEMTRILDALVSNNHIKHLKIGANYNAIKPRQRIEVMEKLARLVQSSPTIESLSLADSKLKGDITILLNDLMSNKSLNQLDISGNLIGDVGLRILARVLVLNTHIRDLSWDKNNLSLQSLEEMAKSLEHNHTLQYLRTPGIDLIPLMQRHPERTTMLLTKIEETLAKNHGLRKMSTDRAFKLHLGLMSSTTHQLIDKLIVELDGRCSRLEKADPDLLTDESREAITNSRATIRDAQASKQLLASMQEVLSREEDRNTLISKSLVSVTSQLRTSMEEQSKSDLQMMLDLAKSSCGFIEKDENFQSELHAKCKSETIVSPRFLDNLVAHTLTNGMYNKITEMNLSVASLISDEILDEAVKHLDECHRLVNRHLANLVTVRRRQKQATESVSSDSTTLDEQEAAVPTKSTKKEEPANEDEVGDLEEVRNRTYSAVKVRNCRPRSAFAVVDVSDGEESDEKVPEKPVRRSAPLPPTSVTDKPEPRSRSILGVQSTNSVVSLRSSTSKADEAAEKKPMNSSTPRVSESDSRPGSNAKISVSSLGAIEDDQEKAELKEIDAIEEKGKQEEEEEVKVEMHAEKMEKEEEKMEVEEVKEEKKDEETNGKAGEGTPSLASPMTTHSERSVASRSMDSLDSLDALSPLPESASASPTLLSHPARNRPKRPRQHRPTRTTIMHSDASDDLFSPTPGSETALEEEDSEKPPEKAASSPKDKRSPSSSGTPETEKKSRTGSSSGLKTILKKFPGSSHKKSASADPPKPSKKPAKEEVKEVKEVKEIPPAPVEEVPEEPPARPVRPRGPPMIPGLNLNDIQKRRQEMRSTAPSNTGNGTDASTAKPLTPTSAHDRLSRYKGRPDSPGGRPPNFQLPTLRPVALRERESKTPAQREEEKEKRLSVRDRAAIFNPGANAGAPPPPPKPAKKPSIVRDRPTPPEKPQGIRLNTNVQSSTSNA